jgi:hypothetical protein
MRSETEIVVGEFLEKKSMNVVKKLNQQIQGTKEMNFPKCSLDELDIYLSEDVNYNVKNVLEWWKVGF